MNRCLITKKQRQNAGNHASSAFRQSSGTREIVLTLLARFHFTEHCWLNKEIYSELKVRVSISSESALTVPEKHFSFLDALFPILFLGFVDVVRLIQTVLFSHVSPEVQSSTNNSYLACSLICIRKKHVMYAIFLSRTVSYEVLFRSS